MNSKRVLDLALTVPTLIVSLPLQAAITVAIRATMGSPVFFRQQRPGLHGQPFELVKFRTMRLPDAERGLVDDADRLTSLGRFLRSTSLDELPTLWNIVRGDLSIVGPRPLLMQYRDRYTPEQAARHNVRPGLTGLAQVNGRNAISWEDKFSYDVEYVNHHPLRGDLQIILRTFIQVFRRHGVNAADHVTMPEFMGSNSE